MLSVLAGDDRGGKKVPPKTSPAAAALMRLVPGVGALVGGRWAEAAEQDVVKALSMTEKKLSEVKGLHKGIRKALEDIRNASS